MKTYYIKDITDNTNLYFKAAKQIILKMFPEKINQKRIFLTEGEHLYFMENYKYYSVKITNKKWSHVEKYYTFEDICFEEGISPGGIKSVTQSNSKYKGLNELRKLTRHGLLRTDIENIKKAKTLIKIVKNQIQKSDKITIPIMEKVFTNDGYVVKMTYKDNYQKVFQLNKNRDIINQRSYYLGNVNKTQQIFIKNKITNKHALSARYKQGDKI